MRVAMLLLAWLPASIACSGSGTAPEGEAPERGPRAPILVFGVDGMEWGVLLPLVQSGQMPTFRSLMERGHFGELSTLVPTKSPRLWTSIATGKPPEEHGIAGFVIRPRKAGESLRQYTSADRRVKAHWNILSDFGVRSDTLGWWVTWPVEPVRGSMVAQTNTLANARTNPKGALLEGKPSQVWPLSDEAFVFATLRASEERLDTHMEAIFGPVAEQLDSQRRARWKQCRWSFRADWTYVSVLEAKLAERGPAAVTAIYIGGADVAGHRFWAAYEPEAFGLSEDSVEARTFGHIIPAYYRFLDEVLGRLIAAYPTPPTVLIVSDHGMAAVPELAAQGPRVDLEKFTGGHRDGAPGLLIAAGPNISAAPGRTPIDALERSAVPRIGSILDFCPTLLALAGVPYGEDMSGRPLRQLIDPAWLDELEPASIPTHDDPAWRAARAQALRIEASDERLMQFRNLGYLGEDGEED